MEITFKDEEWDHDYGTSSLVKLNDYQNMIDPEWRKLGISDYYYHHLVLKNGQEIYLLDKSHYVVGGGWGQIKPTKIIRHKNGGITLRFNKMKVSIGVLVCY